MDEIQDLRTNKKAESLQDILKEIKKEKGIDVCANDDDDYDRQSQPTHHDAGLHNSKKAHLGSSELSASDECYAMVTKIKQEPERDMTENNSENCPILANIKCEPQGTYLHCDSEHCKNTKCTCRNEDNMNYALENNRIPSEEKTRHRSEETKALIENLVLSVNVYSDTENKYTDDLESQIKYGHYNRVKLMIKISSDLLEDVKADGTKQRLPCLGASHGLYTTSFLPVGVIFGPYQDSISNDSTPTSNCLNLSKLNWMRFVRCAGANQKKNLETIRYQSKICYRTVCDIPAGSELLLLANPYNLNNEECVSASGCSNTNKYVPGLFISSRTKGIRRLSSYKCNVCGKECSTLDNLTEHMLMHISGKQYVCTICSKRFADGYTLKTHIRVHTGEKPYVCNKCGKGFAQSSTLLRHMKTHTKPYECSLCGKEFQQAIQLQRHNYVHNGELPYQCIVCGKSYPTSSNLDYHMRTHTGVRPHRCAECGKGFIQPCQLKRHMLLHTGEKPYKCPICSQCFTQSGHLASHIRMHTGEKPHKCNTCGKLYKDSSSLKRHEQSHSGELPYCCIVCDKRFCRSSDLTKHKIVHSKERPYKCTVCEKAFPRSDRLLTHIRIHTGEKPYECNTCGKRFAMNSDLKKHNMIHTGEKPLQCPQCEKRFRSHGDLKRHIRTHTGEKPYSCDICSRVFCTLGNMKKHKKTHTKGK